MADDPRPQARRRAEKRQLELLSERIELKFKLLIVFSNNPGGSGRW